MNRPLSDRSCEPSPHPCRQKSVLKPAVGFWELNYLLNYLVALKLQLWAVFFCLKKSWCMVCFQSSAFSVGFCLGKVCVLMSSSDLFSQVMAQVLECNNGSTIVLICTEERPWDSWSMTHRRINIRSTGTDALLLSNSTAWLTSMELHVCASSGLVTIWRPLKSSRSFFGSWRVTKFGKTGLSSAFWYINVLHIQLYEMTGLLLSCYKMKNHDLMFRTWIPVCVVYFHILSKTQVHILLS